MLTFKELREKNNERQLFWGGVDNWLLVDWSNAVAGEVGEAANVVKKLRRIDLGTTGNHKSPEELREQLKLEIGDIGVYLDLFARAAGLTLEECVTAAFNSKSDELGFPVKLGDD